MSYWRRCGYEDGVLGYPEKSWEFFSKAQQVEHYETYLEGYRMGKVLRERNAPL